MGTNILVVDEAEITGLELSEVLKGLNINFISAKNEHEAAKVLGNTRIKIDAVVYSLDSVEIGDLDRVKAVKSMVSHNSVPVIVISRFTGQKYIINAIEAGANEYIVKPYDKDMVQKKFYKILGISADKQKHAFDEDITTFSFMEMLNREIKSAGRGGHILSVMMISVVIEKDRVSANANMDTVIGLLNNIAKVRLRDTDTVFRYGENSLVLLLPYTDLTGIKAIEEKISNEFGSNSVIVKVNDGCKLLYKYALFPEDGKTAEKLLGKLGDILLQ